ncbi:class I SAM-dependent DNA methyltransferase [Peptostreptococcus faecalis]|uniref:class I SAM-dependent DNA methyltransferase n=1 Tax=Peptostreptococcus faecalis TaxID=2045015 RepID=UPI000C7A4C49|nr:class I SAM-dependent methyltransferase [Peptostreptococcus faecalis]
MKQYENFAYIYDELMDDVDYENWVYHIERLISRSGKKVKNILELACGTGNITIPLAKKGYDIVGVDISEDMLSVAYDKSKREGINLVLLEQDMTELEFDLYDLDCVVCSCDGFNYITSSEDLKSVFKKVNELLKSGGIFVFDISSHYKISEILGNNFMGESRDNLAYMWENYYDEENHLIDMELDFFVKIDNQEDEEIFQRYRETHQQRAYGNEEIIALLKEANFDEINIFGDFSTDDPKFDSERIFFTAIKK